ncbi:Uncharacterized protein involved in exopolysaccharide biosynthesis [Methylomagnum ishizawai]|uniref:Uncharacterized protein involved in exopolysaccharide biosynthesis n=1 Tax=Methylomagnum ishizawai TaxID=1760988 RepID=A0A1Y6DA80_9GAMM|nr:hypothetical protein [Methylomagnum ishizawai]SMF97094.1 Uncharacterized protein involved in exopolysaccharide biosynthesis [Methylomagnum ishizawai]
MPASPPNIEFFPNPPLIEPPQPPNRRRPWLFGGVFVVSLAASLGYVWSREPVYQSTASVLTVAPNAIDETSRIDVQQIAVQRQTLLDVALLQAALERLRQAAPDLKLGLDEVRGMLQVEPVADTNVLRLSAQGAKPEILAPVVNAWLEAYGAFREQALREQKTQTSSVLDEEAQRLAEQIAAKHRQLDQFRAKHGILSKNDAENQAIARLNGLTAALNKASDEEVQTQAKLDAVQAAIAKGEPVVPPRDEAGLAQLQFSAHLLREQVKDLERKYTPQYIKMQANLKVIPEQLAQAEADIRKMVERGRDEALSEAKQAYVSAAQSVRAIRKQIEEHKAEVSEFTARFAEQEALEEEVKRLEEVYRDTQARLAQVAAKPTDKLPRYQVVERAYTPVKPLWPDYARDSGIAFAGSLGTALLVLLIYDFLTRREKPAAAAPLTMPNINVYSVPENLMLQRQGPPPAPALGRAEAERTLALESPFPRELELAEVALLFEAADTGARQLLGLLLAGVGLEEAAALGPEAVDMAGDRLRLDGAAPRELPLAPRLKAELAETQGRPAWYAETPPDPEDLAAHIAFAAADAGLPAPETVDAQVLRHTYIVYLVRRGIRLADLEKVVGKLPLKSAAAYARYSPPGQGLRADAVPLVYPALLD